MPYPTAIDFFTYRIFDQQTKYPPGKFKAMVKILRKVVNSFSIIPLIEDLENRCLIYVVINEKGKMRKYVKCFLRKVAFRKIILFEKAMRAGPYT